MKKCEFCNKEFEVSQAEEFKVFCSITCEEAHFEALDEEYV